MPLYEYLCDACGRRFELIRKFSDPPLESCPTCGGTVQKQASSPAIQFKGTGWYITDYAKKSSGGDGSKADGSKSETKATGGDEKGGEGKSGSDKKSGDDNKSAPKTDSTSTSSESTPAASTASSSGTSSKNS